MKNIRLKSLALFLMGMNLAADPATRPIAPPPQSLPTVELPLGNAKFKVQVADDGAEREAGLMYVASMPADRGMIFLFPDEQPRSFWMRNTLIDLDIVFVDHTGKVVAVKTMKALDETPVPSDGPADIAIELNAGAAEKAGVSVGDKLAIPIDLLAKAR